LFQLKKNYICFIQRNLNTFCKLLCSSTAVVYITLSLIGYI